jgi:hypothetical protein
LLKRIREFALGHPQYPLIGITGLAGFNENAGAKWRFEKGFLVRFVFSTIITFAASGLFMVMAYFAGRRDNSSLTGVLVLLSLACFAVGIFSGHRTWRQMIEAVPICVHCGQPMEVYQLRDTIRVMAFKTETCELVYVCRADQTFFRREFISS